LLLSPYSKYQSFNVLIHSSVPIYAQPLNQSIEKTDIPSHSIPTHSPFPARIPKPIHPAIPMQKSKKTPNGKTNPISRGNNFPIHIPPPPLISSVSFPLSCKCKTGSTMLFPLYHYDKNVDKNAWLSALPIFLRSVVKTMSFPTHLLRKEQEEIIQKGFSDPGNNLLQSAQENPGARIMTEVKSRDFVVVVLT
jgi:hypothetical protein